MPKRNSRKEFIFSDYPDFRPNLSPREIFKLGSFGGSYWRPIYSGVTKKNYKNKHKSFPSSWWKGIPKENLVSEECDIKKNKYKVRVGTSLKFWEKKKWITKDDPYGWVQWYCNFYKGRRSSDDERQIKRWMGVCGEKGRFKKWLISQIKKKRTTWDDENISPKIRQTLQHWGYKLNKYDFDNYKK